MKLGISGLIFEKYSNVTFHKILLLGAELFHVAGERERQRDGRTDRETD
jgi:hypothetical protein